MRKSAGILLIYLACVQPFCFAQEKLRIVLAGLTHDHVNGILGKNQHGDAVIIGIAEADQQLCDRMKTKYQLPDSVFYRDLATALKKNRPDLVMVYNAPTEHLKVIETCMPLHIPVMVEKPLCFSYTEAVRIEMLSKKFNTRVYTNYVSNWYTSNLEIYKRVNEKKEVGTIHKMIMHGGHRGPVEIGCSKDFLGWLTDPVKNGGGALTDFGCYGASIMTELMQGKMPVSVIAITRHLKPGVCPKVDDDATILLEYPGATGIIEASWSWPYTIMDVEVYGNEAYLHATDATTLQSKNEKETRTAEVSPIPYKDELEYLTAVIKNGAPDNNKLLSLERNVVVVRILDAARRSVKEGRKISL
ncbi:MAG: oxidoreductase domain protein [Chitinophagaceae bacterium]|nr:oxidoreductase domain protein [Chitinophagaceae bacterium]